MEINYALKDLETVANSIIEKATSKVILFKAEMGMGKTTLIKALVKALGSTDEVSSPTYSLVNEYKLEKDSVYHFDLYRLNSEEEAYDFGIEEYFNSNNWIFIEWPEIIESILPENFSVIHIQNDENLNRKLKFER